MLIGLLPASTKAATKNVTVDYLGYCGTVTCGSKTKSGKWWKMQVNGRTVFCMDLGNTCHNGDAYKSSSKTYSTADGGTSKQMASLAYWFDKTMKRSNRAYIMTQALVWSIENGGTSQAKLKDALLDGKISVSVAEKATELNEEEQKKLVKKAEKLEQEGKKLQVSDVTVQSTQKVNLSESEWTKDTEDIVAMLQQNDVKLDEQALKKYHFYIKQIKKIVGGRP